MRLDPDRQSDNVEDIRGQSGGGRGPGLKLGLGGTLIALAAAYFLGIDPRVVLGLVDGTQQSAPASADGVAPSQPADAQGKWMSSLLADTEDTWGEIFKAGGSQYIAPKLVLFSNAVRTGCGNASSGAGPFYCPEDQKVYIDLAFYDQLEREFKAPGDFAKAYVLAHEVGHHVQLLLGTAEKVQAAQQRASEADRNALQVRMELQADCYAGIWANHADRSRHILEAGDVEEALKAAAAVGDDTIQRRVQGEVVPETFTHGSAQQRMTWFRRGIDNGTLAACDTFKAGA
jgi:predicted metalloprotease